MQHVCISFKSHRNEKLLQWFNSRGFGHFMWWISEFQSENQINSIKSTSISSHHHYHQLINRVTQSHFFTAKFISRLFIRKDWASEQTEFKKQKQKNCSTEWIFSFHYAQTAHLKAHWANVMQCDAIWTTNNFMENGLIEL